MDGFIYQIELNSGCVSKIIANYFSMFLNLWRTLFCVTAYCLSSKEKRHLVESDFGTFYNMVKSLIFCKHDRNLFYHRMGRISVLYSWLLPGESSIVFPFSCSLGEHCHFVHNRGCHLNAKSIGKDFVCYAYVVIGAKSLECSDLPTIGDNVTLGTGVVVVGGINIGNNVKIAANAFVNKSIPDNCIVMGNPAKIVMKDGVKLNK